MKDFCLENNNSDYSSIVNGDNNNIKDNCESKVESSPAEKGQSFDYFSVLRQLNKNKCKKAILNEHDIKHAMLHANQVNLKNSLIHGTAKNQLVNLNFFSSADGKLDQRKSLEKLSLQYVLSKGKRDGNLITCIPDNPQHT